MIYCCPFRYAEQKRGICMLQKDSVIVFQGDSITDAGCWGDPRGLGMGYPKMVADHISSFYTSMNITLYNRGISGNRSIDLVNRWDRDCIDLHPTIVTLLIGINDTWRKFDSNSPTSTEEYRSNCENIMKRTKDAGAQLVVLEPFTIPKGVITTEWYADIDPKINALRELSRKYADAYVPLNGIFAKLSIETSPDIWSGDGVHPSEAGHRIIADEILKIIE